MERLALAVLLVSVLVGCGAKPAATVDADLRILDGARALLPDEARWNRQDNRECPAGATRRSLFCALHDASIEVLGSYDHRRAALEAVRAAIEEVAGGREFEHRLMDFNNLESTTLADVHRVIAIARARIGRGSAAVAHDAGPD